MIPKFRAWDKTTNKMRGCYGFNAMEREVYVCSVADDEFDGRLKTVHALRRSFDEVVLMQSTGLADMNGTMIYEGDIVKMQWTIYDEPELFYIRTIEGRAPRVDNRIKGKELWLVHQDCKVVGNIYQDCELLEVAE